MSFCSTNMYSIPECSATDETSDGEYTEISVTVKEPEYASCGTGSSSNDNGDNQPEQRSSEGDYCEILDSDPKRISVEDRTGSEKTAALIRKKFSVSLIDFSEYGLTSDSGASNVDKLFPFANIASRYAEEDGKLSMPYLKTELDKTHSNQDSHYDELITPYLSLKEQVSDSSSSNTGSIGFNFVDLNAESGRRSATADVTSQNHLRPGDRQRSGSMQWLHTAFQSVGARYRQFVEPRRPSDIVEDRLRQTNEEIEMNSSISVPKVNPIPAAGGRRFSENILGKQKKSPFISGIGHLRGFLKDRIGQKKLEDKESDQNRPDVCPLFNFPRKAEEDELILDALRQAMRKCTAVDPTTRPNSGTVLEQLAKLGK